MLAALASGLINASAILLDIFDIKGVDSVGLPVTIFGAGPIFGLVTGVFLYRATKRSKRALRFIGWVIAASVSYFSAVYVTLHTPPQDFSPQPEFYNFGIGGLMGAAIISVAYHFLWQKLTVGSFVTVIIVGALVPLVLVLLAEGHDMTIPILYVLWQSIIMALLVYFKKRV